MNSDMEDLLHYVCGRMTRLKDSSYGRGWLCESAESKYEELDALKKKLVVLVDIENSDLEKKQRQEELQKEKILRLESAVKHLKEKYDNIWNQLSKTIGEHAASENKQHKIKKMLKEFVDETRVVTEHDFHLDGTDTKQRLNEILKEFDK